MVTRNSSKVELGNRTPPTAPFFIEGRKDVFEERRLSDCKPGNIIYDDKRGYGFVGNEIVIGEDILQLVGVCFICDTYGRPYFRNTAFPADTSFFFVANTIKEYSGR